MKMPIEFQVYELLKKYHITLTTAESATGGMIASTLINVPGISEFFQEGYVTYSNDAKVKMIGVDRELIDTYGVVSREVAENMAISAAKTARAEAALSITGVAGPDGGTVDCPVGTVYIGCFLNGQTFVEHHVFDGKRIEVREKATNRALTLLVEQINFASQNREAKILSSQECSDFASQNKEAKILSSPEGSDFASQNREDL